MHVIHIVSDKEADLEERVNTALAELTDKARIIPTIQYQMTDRRFSALIIWYPR